MSSKGPRMSGGMIWFTNGLIDNDESYKPSKSKKSKKRSLRRSKSQEVFSGYQTGVESSVVSLPSVNAKRSENSGPQFNLRKSASVSSLKSYHSTSLTRPTLSSKSKKNSSKNGKSSNSMTSLSANAVNNPKIMAFVNRLSTERSTSRRSSSRDWEEEEGGKKKQPKPISLKDLDKLSFAQQTMSNKEKMVATRVLSKWKQRNNVKQSTKVFSDTETLPPQIRRMLIRRGWVPNPDEESNLYNLRWNTYASDFDWDNRTDDELANHFPGCLEHLAAKNHLFITLAKAHDRLHDNYVPPEEFTARSYDLSQHSQFLDFVDDFRASAAEAILKIFMYHCDHDIDATTVFDAEDLATMIKVALHVTVERVDNLCGYHEQIDYPVRKKLTDDEWEIVLQFSLDYLYKLPHRYQLSQQEEDAYNKWLEEETFTTTRSRKPLNSGTFQVARDRIYSKYWHKFHPELKSEELWPSSNNSNTSSSSSSSMQSNIGPISSINTSKLKIRCIESAFSKASLKHNDDEETDGESSGYLVQDSDNDNDVDNNDLDYLQLATAEVLAKLETLDEEYAENDGNNIWIVKPSSGSMGWGIMVGNNVVKMLDYVNSSLMEERWIAQKYVERPIIYKGRRFDCRQWVLITNYNPMTIFFYDTCYFRFTSSKYTVDHLDDVFAHLCNGAVQKKSVRYDQMEEVDHNIMLLPQMQEWLTQEWGRDVWTEELKPRMIETVKTMFHTVAPDIGNPKNTFELYGLDFLYDSNLKTYLIEVNTVPVLQTNPDIPYTKITTQMLNDLLKVVVDNKMDPFAEDTGNWVLIDHSSTTIPGPAHNGLVMSVQGTAIDDPSSSSSSSSSSSRGNKRPPSSGTMKRSLSRSRSRGEMSNNERSASRSSSRGGSSRNGNRSRSGSLENEQEKRTLRRSKSNSVVVDKPNRSRSRSQSRNGNTEKEEEKITLSRKAPLRPVSSGASLNRRNGENDRVLSPERVQRRNQRRVTSAGDGGSVTRTAAREKWDGISDLVNTKHAREQQEPNELSSSSSTMSDESEFSFWIRRRTRRTSGSEEQEDKEDKKSKTDSRFRENYSLNPSRLKSPGKPKSPFNGGSRKLSPKGEGSSAGPKSSTLFELAQYFSLED